MDYRTRLKDIRTRRSYTQEQIASVLGVRQATYSGYESGRIGMSIENLVLLAKFYDVSVDYLSGASDNTEHAYPAW